jgi:hypothetical protein
MRFNWLVFICLCLVLAEQLGLPPRLAQALIGVVLLLMLLVLVGVL